jgi:cell division protein FtsB
VVVLLLAVAAWAYYPVARVQYHEERQKTLLEAELAGLQERNADLRARVDRLKTPEGVEEIARESLGMVKEGEHLYVVVDDESEEPTVVVEPNTATIPQPEASVWQRALDLLFGVE